MKTKCLLLLSVLTLALWSCQKEEPIMPVEQTEAAVEQAEGVAPTATPLTMIRIYINGGKSPYFGRIFPANNLMGYPILNLGRCATHTDVIVPDELGGNEIVVQIYDSRGIMAYSVPFKPIKWQHNSVSVYLPPYFGF